MQVRYVKPHGPYAVGDVREAAPDEAAQLLAYGIVEPAGQQPVRRATVPPAPGKKTAAVRHGGG